ncbi:hypothetical protein C2845_PM02G19240 [Panicum miliaceum]|uniref:Serine/threonine-protein kinase BSK1-like TPR repeats domain-containing protein n=1 Tax=Panicum miliaceum TaxID=4540 RepID=A0A3L6SC57_PANMI|nr:hypothetical protein C2845_PM02G19240 [Panicum miliaceum]
MGGFGVLHCAACQDHLEVCKYLVEELGGDPNMTGGEGQGPVEGLHQNNQSPSPNSSCHVRCDTVYGLCSIWRYFHCEAGADVNGKGSVASPLVFATGHGGYTDFIRLLLKAGADLIFQMINWSIDGIISHAKLENAKPMNKEHVKKRKVMLKSQADKAFRRKEYAMASKLYTEVIGYAGPDATLYSNRSLCKLKMGDGEGALSDAYQCRMMRPDWAKACYRQATAHMLLKEYEQAYGAFLDAQKLDPGNEEIERELSKAMELMKTPPDEDEE